MMRWHLSKQRATSGDPAVLLECLSVLLELGWQRRTVGRSAKYSSTHVWRTLARAFAEPLCCECVFEAGTCRNSLRRCACCDADVVTIYITAKDIFRPSE